MNKAIIAVVLAMCLLSASAMAYVNLYPQSFTANKYNVTVNETVVYTLVVGNNGTTNSTAFYSKIAFNPLYAPWSGLYTPSLAPGATSIFVRQTYYSTPGWYQINATVDWKGQVNETNEGDNFASLWVFVR